MNALIKQTFIRTKATERKIKWSRHALNALASELASVGDIEIALRQAEVIEDYPHLHRYLPDCLVLAFVLSDMPTHCVIAGKHGTRLHFDCYGLHTNGTGVGR